MTGTQTEVGNSKNAFTYTLNEGTKAANYTITTVEGTLTVTPVTEKVTVKITENSGSEKYDGTEKTVTGYTVTISNDLYTEADFTFSGDATVKGTDAGTYAMELKPEDFTNISKNFTNVEFVIVDGQLEITKRTVTLTSADDEKVYDGTALTNDTVTVSGDGFAEGEGATFDVTGTQTNVGESKNAFTYTLNEGTKADNYTITTVEGTLTVTPVTDKVTVTITENSGSEKYDGTEKTVTGYTVSIDNELYTEDDFTFSGDATVKGTDAGSYSMGLSADDFENISTNFTNVEFVIVEGSLDIAKREVTLTSADDEKVYDGTALTNDTVTVSGDGFVEGEGATYDVTGSQTDAGESNNTFTYTLNDGTKADNYDITVVEGTLTVTPYTDEVVVKIIGNNKEVTFDGKEQTVEGYTVDIDNELYTEADFAFNGTDSVSGTDAGTYNMGLTPVNFENISKNFTNVTFEVEDGTLIINKRHITITSASDSKTYDGTELTKHQVTIEVEGGETIEGEIDQTEFTLETTGDKITNVNVTGTQTYVGSSDNEFTYEIERGAAPLDRNRANRSFLAAVREVKSIIVEAEEGAGRNYIVEVVYGTLEVTDDIDNPDDIEELVLKKTHDEKEFALGETVTFTIEATNIYDENKTITLVEIEGVELSESVFENVAPGASISATATYTVTEADILAGEFKNTVTVKFSGENTEFEDEDIVDVEDPKPHMTIVKETTSEPANGETYALGEEITYLITVTNDGNVTLTNVVVTDELTGDEWTIESLAPNVAETFETSYTVTEEDIINGSVLNEATATAEPPEDVDDPEIVPGTKEEPTEEKNPHLTVTKETTSTPANGKTYALDETIEYKITVTNDGNVTISDVKVTDDLTGDEWTIEALKPGESKEFTASYTVTEEDIRTEAKVVNNATATGKDPEDEDPAVDPGKTEDQTDESKSHLTIEKTVTNSPKNGKEYYEGETIEYKIVVKNDGNQTMKDIKVTDELTGDEWTIETLAPGEEKEFTAKYTVTAADVKAGKVTNTATATGTSVDPNGKPEVTPGTTDAKTGEPEKNPDIPKTGDTTSTGMLASMLVASMLGMGGTMVLKRKKEEEEA